MYMWPNDDEPERAEDNLQVHVCRLRKVLGTLGLKINSIKGCGYSLTEADEVAYTIDTRRGSNYWKAWTEEEYELARSMAVEGRSLREISEALPNRTETAIRIKLMARYGLRGVQSSHDDRPWTDDETKKVRRLWKQGLTVTEIAKRLDRSELRVRARLYFKRIGHDDVTAGRRQRA
jgi:hypothetical protein